MHCIPLHDVWCTIHPWPPVQNQADELPGQIPEIITITDNKLKKKKIQPHTLKDIFHE